MEGAPVRSSPAEALDAELRVLDAPGALATSQGWKRISDDAGYMKYIAQAPRNREFRFGSLGIERVRGGWTVTGGCVG